jgi:serine/threonine protein kinase
MTIKVGDSIGAYQIVARIGEGETATVFKAYHAALDRYVAIKALHPAFTEDPTFLARFQREARVVANLDHPNIVPIYDFSAHGGTPYLVMKFVAGESLTIKLSHGPMPLEECTRILGAVGGALSHAHHSGILHRDLKPSNVIIEEDGDVYLTDFGLARVTRTGASGVTSGLVLGSPYYMSPEQGQDGAEVDERSDQYSLAVVVYEMLTGDLPFVAGNVFGVVQGHLHTPPPRPSATNPRLTKAIDDVILTALSKERTKRFPNIKTFVESFQQVAAPPRPPTAPIRKAELTQALAAVEPADGGVSIMLVLQLGGQMINLKGRNEYWLGRSEPTRPVKPEVDLAEHQGMELGVSRQHGLLKFEDGRLYYTDMKSSNGSRVNGARLRPEIPMLLKDGDEVIMGRLAFRIYFAF